MTLAFTVGRIHNAWWLKNGSLYVTLQEPCALNTVREWPVVVADQNDIMLSSLTPTEAAFVSGILVARNLN